MASPEVLDFDTLLALIPGDNPAGADLRTDPSPVSDYHRIRDARKAASGVERRNDQGDDAGPADWKSVVDLGKKVLASKSKDMEVTAYLIEGLVRLEGLAGLRDGFRLARELVDRFWDNLYPGPGVDDDESRFSAMFWLSGIDRPGTLIVPIRKVPFTAKTGAGCFSLMHHQVAVSLEQVTDAKVRQKRVEEGAVSLELIRRAISETPPTFYADLLEDLAQSREEFLGFCTTFREKSGYDPPGSDLLGALESYRDQVSDLAREKLPKASPPPAEPAAEGGGGVAGGEPQAPPKVDPAVIRDRDDALGRLGKVAEYFRENEPQSIIPFALEQVIAWGRMPLPELLSELIPEDGPRKNLFKQVGIRLPDAKK